GINLALEQDFNVKVIAMEKDKDPADVVSQNPDDWQKAIEQAKEIMAFYFDTALNSFDSTTPQGKKQIAEALLSQIKKISNNILQFHWVQKLSSILNVSEESILQEIKKIKPDSERKTRYNESNVPVASFADITPTQVKLRRILLAERMLGSILQHKESRELINDDLVSVCPANIASILCALKQNQEQGLDQYLKKIFDNCAFQSEIDESDEPEKEVKLCSNFLIKLSLQSQLKDISEKIKQEEQKSDSKILIFLIQQFNELVKQVKS
ncbi:MAG: hypothetical protein HQ539_01410, partial [Parcubacteria group bacterium]|nr:hypothetical protein [Parcubacteria group bacterium]